MDSKKDIMSMTQAELKDFVVSLGEGAFRAKQLFKWMHSGTPIDEMSNLSKAFREKLKDTADYRLPKIEEKFVSKIDGTVKYLFSLNDGECVESVLMRYEHGNTICVSSQAGCRMGCKFCASTLGGKVRDLSAGEILSQVLTVMRDVGERISNIVMMGIGEPLDNYENVIKFLRLVGSPDGVNIGYRHISLSTCGVVPGIYALAKEEFPITLSISLHSTNDAERSELMPVNRKWGIDELLSACRSYFDTTGRRISFEYTLISGKNDDLPHARDLAKLLKKYFENLPCHVNLIPVNPVKERGFDHGNTKEIRAFCEKLNSLGINATVRRHLGGDIDASCGQLRNSQGNDEEKEE